MLFLCLQTEHVTYGKEMNNTYVFDDMQSGWLSMLTWVHQRKKLIMDIVGFKHLPCSLYCDKSLLCNISREVEIWDPHFPSSGWRNHNHLRRCNLAIRSNNWWWSYYWIYEWWFDICMSRPHRCHTFKKCGFRKYHQVFVVK